MSIPTVKAYMLTCEGRRRTLTETISRLGRTDWGEGPRVLLDSEAIEARGLSADTPRGRMEIASRFLLETALAETNLDYLLFLEDDIDFNRHLRHNLSAWAPLLDRRASYATLYNPRPGFAARERDPGQHWLAVEVNCVYGTQAVLISREACEYIVANWDRRPATGGHDIIFSRLTFDFDQRPVYAHKPSLVEHVAVPSTWGGEAHFAVDFDADFNSGA